MVIGEKLKNPSKRLEDIFSIVLKIFQKEKGNLFLIKL